MPIDIQAYVAEMVRYTESDGHPLRTGEGDKPGWAEIREEAGWHVLGEFPEKLFENEYELEPEYSREWRRNNHQPITKGPIRDAMKDMRRMFLESKQRITDIHPDTFEFISAESFGGETFFEWMFRLPWDMMPLDPNAMIVAMPKGPGLLDDSIRVDVELKVIESGQIRDRDSEKAAWLSYDSSSLKAGGDRYWVIDDTYYYLVEEMPEHNNGTKRFEITEYYEHGTGEVLLQILGGFCEYRRGWILYRSFFEGYFPFANDALDEYSTYKVTHRRLAFPRSWEVERDCDAVNPDDPNQVCYQGYWGDRVCGSCGGSGKVSTLHPGQTIRVTAPEPGETFNMPMGYIETPDGTFETMRDSWERLLQLGEKAMNARFIEEAQSGEAKDRDLEGRYTSFQTVADWYYGNVVQGTIEMIVKLRRRNDWQDNLPTVIPPVEFKLRTSADLLQELKALAEANPTSGMYVETVREFVDKKFGRDNRTKRKNELQLILDPVAVLDDETKNMLVAAGTLDTGAVERSNMSYFVIEKILEQTPSAIDWDNQKWRDEYEKEMSEMFQSEEELADIEGVITGAAADLEAEAKAKIRGSVGGVTGIIQIATAVSQGVLDEAAGEEILVQIYGIAPDVAQRMIQIGTAQGPEAATAAIQEQFGNPE